MKKRIIVILIILLIFGAGTVLFYSLRNNSEGEKTTNTTSIKDDWKAFDNPNTDIIEDETEELKEKANIEKDISYGEEKLQKLDIYPSEKDNSSVVIYVHGGGWAIGDKSNHAKKGEVFSNAGYTFVALNYRLSPEITHPVHVQDVAKGFKWVYENIESYGGDKDKIFLIGHSAGAHLVALLSTANEFLYEQGLTLENIAGTVCLDGAGLNIITVKENNSSSFIKTYEPIFGNNDEELKEASAYFYLDEAYNLPPFLLYYADGRELTKSVANQFSNKLNEKGVESKVSEAYGKDHSGINDALESSDEQVTKNILSFLTVYR
ncbi:MAG: alpha/beta hydrolase [bacterium]